MHYRLPHSERPPETFIAWTKHMATNPQAWKIFDAATPVLIHTYSFGPGTANALAVGVEGGLIVISPPCGAGDAVFDELARHGTVRGLVAPNAFHHMGMALWRQRFPQATVFAPSQAVERLKRQTGQADFRPLGETASLTGPSVSLTEMPHCKTGEALVRITTPKGRVWYITDVVLNMPTLPAHPIAKWLFKLSGSAPGLKFNNLAGLVMVKDKKALKHWLAGQIGIAAPNWFIPGHGDALKLGGDPSPLTRLFAVG